MRYQTTSGRECPKLYQYFMPLQDVILCLASPGETRRFVHSLEELPSRHRYLPTATSTSPISEACMERLERFVILMFERTSNKTSVNETRKQLFAQKGRAYDAIPPTRAALLQHTNRAAYQAGHWWGQALTLSPDLPSPGDWGWIFKEGEWHPFWTTLPDVTKSCKGLLRCGCKRGCRGGCSCTRETLKCTALCSCNDECNNRWLQSIVRFNAKYKTMMRVKWNKFWWNDYVTRQNWSWLTKSNLLVDNVNWPPYRNWKADVSSVSPSSDREPFDER